MTNTVELERMYRIPKELDLSPVAGEFTTQVRVGQFDLQFTFGKANFAIESPVRLIRDGKQVAYWEEGKWPEPGCYDIMNTKVRRCEIVNDRLIVLQFDNGIEDPTSSAQPIGTSHGRMMPAAEDPLQPKNSPENRRYPPKTGL